MMMANRQWKEIRKFEEILFEEYNGIAKITINRSRYRNAFTPRTTLELSQAFAQCRELARIRVYLAYFNNGKVGKAFLLPQEDPELHTFLLKSYNRPEFMVEPVRISVEEFSRVF